MNARRILLVAVVFLTVLGSMVVLRQCSTPATDAQQRRIERGMRNQARQRRL